MKKSNSKPGSMDNSYLPLSPMLAYFRSSSIKLKQSGRPRNHLSLNVTKNKSKLILFGLVLAKMALKSLIYFYREMEKSPQKSTFAGLLQ